MKVVKRQNVTLSTDVKKQIAQDVKGSGFFGSRSITWMAGKGILEAIANYVQSFNKDYAQAVRDEFFIQMQNEVETLKSEEGTNKEKRLSEMIKDIKQIPDEDMSYEKKMKLIISLSKALKDTSSVEYREAVYYFQFKTGDALGKIEKAFRGNDQSLNNQLENLINDTTDRTAILLSEHLKDAIPAMIKWQGLDKLQELNTELFIFFSQTAEDGIIIDETIKKSLMQSIQNASVEELKMHMLLSIGTKTGEEIRDESAYSAIKLVFENLPLNETPLMDYAKRAVENVAQTYTEKSQFLELKTKIKSFCKTSKLASQEQDNLLKIVTNVSIEKSISLN